MEYSVLEELMKTHGISAYRVAKDTGIAFSSFSDWKSGRSSPKADKLEILADYFGTSISALLGREKSGGESAQTRHVAVISEHAVPVIRKICAESPIVTEKTLVGYEPAHISSPETADDYFYLVAGGNSLKSIGAVDGSLLLFRKQQYARDGDIVVCVVGGSSAVVGRYSRVGKNILITTDNDERTTKLKSTDFESGKARILGIATEIKTKLAKPHSAAQDPRTKP